MAVLVLLLLLQVSRADAPTFDTWVSRGDGAAANVHAAAEALAGTAQAIKEAGRATRFAELHTQAEALVKRADLLVATLRTEPPE